MKIFIAIISIITLMNCQTNKNETMEENKNYQFYLGTYTDSTSQGIYKFILKEDGTIEQKGLVAVSDNPSFLAISTDRRFLLAVDEINRDDIGTVKSFLITDDSLKLISKSSSGGAHPCFVAVNEFGYVLAANYTGGNIGLLKHNANGELSDILDIQQHSGSGGTKRQQGPHAHSAWFEPNSNKVISVDLGTNELLFSHIDTGEEKLLPSDPYKIEMEPGAGPRHLAFHPNGNSIYVVNELDCTVTLLKKSDDGKYEKGVSISTLPVDYTESNTCADIHISKDGKFLYASNRGHNSIAIFEINPADGSLKFITHESTRGNGPRNFSLSPDDNFLLVANQHTRNIVSFKRNKETGLLNFVSEVDAPTPVCIVF
jgi:6-phosphogluconolactonase